MKNLSFLVWLTQLGLSVVFPLADFTLVAVWLRLKFELGIWIIIAGIFLGLICAVNGFISSLKILNRLLKDKKSKNLPMSFNDHD